VVSTESNQSSGNRNIPASRDDSWEEERQRTGLFRWEDPENLMPPWSVPPGLMVPGPRQPDADAQPADPGPQPADPRPRPAGAEPAEQAEPAEPAEPPAGSGSWPGVAPPAGWFLHPAQPPSAAHQERTSAQQPLGDQPSQRFTLRVPAPAPAPDTGFPLSDTARPEPPVESGPPAEPEPHGTATPASPWPNVRAVPSPTREPDGSWSSPLPPKPARRPLGPTQARYGRAGGPGFQPTRSDQSGPQGADAEGPGLSPWQRSHQLWAEAGIEWERRPAPQLPWHPTASRSATRSARARQAPPPRPPAPQQTPEQPSDQASWLGAYAPVGWAGRTPVPLGAPVYSEPGVDEDDGPAGDDRWGDDEPPIRQRPPGLAPEDEAEEVYEAYEPDEAYEDSDALLFDHRRPDSRRPGSRRTGRRSRRTMRIAVPVIVVVAVAALALALLTGHGPKVGPATSDQHKTPNTAAPRLPMGAVTFDTYPGQQQRGVFQVINRIVAVGNTMVTTGSQTSDGVVRQQFLVSANAGASWHLAPVHSPGGGQAALGHPATLLAGGPGGWVATGSHAIWTSRNGLTWTLAATHGITPRMPGDVVWVLNKTSTGYLAAGIGNGPGQRQHTGVIWTSRDGLTWQRHTAAQLGLAGPGETVPSISYITSRGNATVISGAVTARTGVYSAAWLSTNGGTAWTRLKIPAGHGAGTTISGVASDGSGLIAVRPGRTPAGAPDGIADFSADGRTWRYAATIEPDPNTGGWTPSVVKGSSYGFVVTGTTAEGQLVAHTSTGTGTSWLPTGPLGRASVASVSGATVAPGGTVVAIGATAASKISQQPVFLEAAADGTVRSVSLAGIAGATIPEMKINSTAVAGGLQIAVGSANGYPAVWRRTSAGVWTLVSSLGLVAADTHLRALTSVTHGPAGWLAVGAPGPVVLTSGDGEIWGVAGGNITQDLAGVSAVAATSGPAGYVIVGRLVAAGGGCVADVWWSANMANWTRAHDVNLTDGSSQVLAVAAGTHGFVSVGSHNSQPAAWITTNGRSWKTIVMPSPGGASAGALQQVAVNGNRVVALGQGTIGKGPAVGSATGTEPGAVPFAELSTDGGATWQQVPFSSPGPYTSFTALTADAAGFTAAGLFGQPGQQDVALWESATGGSWKPYQSGGLNGSAAWQIDTMTRSGAQVAGIGTVITQQSHQTVTFTLPAR
jgi:hypothetical protein